MGEVNATYGFSIPGYSGFRLLGRGGFSSVFEARQEAYDRSVAVKVLDIGIDDDATRRRFKRECATTGRLTGHPNIVTILDSGFLPDGRPYLAMQLCSGGSLGERLEREGPLPVADVLRVGVKIAGALRTAHLNGVVHRDIKPENILLTSYSEPALADFGISIVTSQSATKRTQAYTPNHAPPEVLSGQLANEASDIYTFGSTLYQLLAGYPPFSHGSSNTGLANYVHQVLYEPAPALVRPDAPRSLNELLRKAMAKHPAERFGTAEEMGRALQAVQTELGLRVDELVVEGSAGTPATPVEQPTAVIGDQVTEAVAQPAPAGYPPPGWEPPQGGKRVGLIVGLVAAAVLLLGGGSVALLLALNADDDGGQANAQVGDRAGRGPVGSTSPSAPSSSAAAEPVSHEVGKTGWWGGFAITVDKAEATPDAYGGDSVQVTLRATFTNLGDQAAGPPPTARLEAGGAAFTADLDSPTVAGGGKATGTITAVVTGESTQSGTGEVLHSLSLVYGEAADNQTIIPLGDGEVDSFEPIELDIDGKATHGPVEASYTGGWLRPSYQPGDKGKYELTLRKFSWIYDCEKDCWIAGVVLDRKSFALASPSGDKVTAADRSPFVASSAGAGTVRDENDLMFVVTEPVAGSYEMTLTVTDDHVTTATPKPLRFNIEE